MGGIGSKTRRVNEEVSLVSRSDRLKMEFALAYKAGGVVFISLTKSKRSVKTNFGDIFHCVDDQHINDGVEVVARFFKDSELFVR